MKKTIRLTERDLSKIVKRILNEEDYDIEGTVKNSKAFTDEDIPVECKGLENTGTSEVEKISACISVITKRSESLSLALTALSDLMSKAESKSLPVSETRIRNKRYNY